MDRATRPPTAIVVPVAAVSSLTLSVVATALVSVDASSSTLVSRVTVAVAAEPAPSVAQEELARRSTTMNATRLMQVALWPG
jgi:hypothetical protein